MAKFFEKILDKLSITDEDDDDFDEEMEERPAKRAERPVRTAEETPVMRKDMVKSGTPITTTKPVTKSTVTNYDDFFEKDQPEKKERPKTADRPAAQSSSASRVVPMRSSKIVEVSVMKPTRLDDAQAICDMLISENATIVILEGLDISLAQRIMDFVFGAVYSLNGKVHQISNLIFIVSPENVEISGDYLSYIEQNGFAVPTLNN